MSNSQVCKYAMTKIVYENYMQKVLMVGKGTGKVKKLTIKNWICKIYTQSKPEFYGDGDLPCLCTKE